MHSTEIDRRSLLAALAGGLTASLLPRRLRAETAHALYLAARADAVGGFRVSGFDAAGELRLDLPLPARGHSFALHPSRRIAVQFARRPGTFAKAVDLAAGTFLAEFETPSDRHFYGHGVFGPDGALLYATENDFEAGRGVIGVYDARDGYRRLGDLPSHGVGPHELRLLGDGTTLVVANGGLATRPDLPRIVLNLPTMAPSLAYVDRRDGRLLLELKLSAELHQLSLRHLALGKDGLVAVVAQYEGPKGDQVPLIAFHDGRGALRPLEGPAAALRAMKHYCGSCAFDSSGTVLGISSPRGGVAVFWDAAEGRLLHSVELPDVCGIAPGEEPGTFLVSSGLGGVFRVASSGAVARLTGAALLDASQWDNHMVRV
ncbi:MAG: DUF1513 domain-containing protein [Kiloniellales bacterium]